EEERPVAHEADADDLRSGRAQRPQPPGELALDEDGLLDGHLQRQRQDQDVNARQSHGGQRHQQRQQDRDHHGTGDGQQERPAPPALRTVGVAADVDRGPGQSGLDQGHLPRPAHDRGEPQGGDRQQQGHRGGEHPEFGGEEAPQHRGGGNSGVTHLDRTDGAPRPTGAPEEAGRARYVRRVHHSPVASMARIGRNRLMRKTSAKMRLVRITSLRPRSMAPNSPAVSIVSPIPSSRHPARASDRLVNPPSTATTRARRKIRRMPGADVPTAEASSTPASAATPPAKPYTPTPTRLRGMPSHQAVSTSSAIARTYVPALVPRRTSVSATTSATRMTMVATWWMVTTTLEIRKVRVPKGLATRRSSAGMIETAKPVRRSRQASE